MGIKDNSRRKGIPRIKKEQRKVEALIRQAAHNALSFDQKVVKAGPKEKARLLKRGAT
jgi:hypothetical protein